MGLFANIENAKATEGGNYLHAGVYDLEVIRLSVGTTRKGVPFFAADFKVIGSNNPDHKPGEVVNWFVGFDKESEGGIRIDRAAWLRARDVHPSLLKPLGQAHFDTGALRYFPPFA